MVDAEGSKGAASGTRTHDLFVTNEMLYRLSYCGKGAIACAKLLNFIVSGTKSEFNFCVGGNNSAHCGFGYVGND